MVVLMGVNMQRCHRHRYHGALATNAPLRQAVSERADLPVNGETTLSEDEKNSVDREGQASRSFYSSIWDAYSYDHEHPNASS